MWGTSVVEKGLPGLMWSVFVLLAPSVNGNASVIRKASLSAVTCTYDVAKLRVKAPDFFFSVLTVLTFPENNGS